MADVTVSSTNPNLLFHDDTTPPGGGTDVWRLRSPSGTATLLLQNWGLGSWPTRFTATSSLLTSALPVTVQDTVTISNTAPTLVFEDTTGSADDFQLKADSNALTVIRDDGSTMDLLTLTDTGTTSHVDLTVQGDLTVSSTTPKIVLEDTTTAQEDFELYLDANLLKVRNERGSGHTLADVSLDGVFRVWTSQATGTNAEEFRVNPHTDGFTATDFDCVAAAGLGDTTRGAFWAQRDGSQDQERMGVLVLQDKAGDDYFLWVDTNGGASAPKLRIGKANFDPGTTEAPSSPDSEVVGP